MLWKGIKEDRFPSPRLRFEITFHSNKIIGIRILYCLFLDFNVWNGMIYFLRYLIYLVVVEKILTKNFDLNNQYSGISMVDISGKPEGNTAREISPEIVRKECNMNRKYPA